MKPITTLSTKFILLLAVIILTGCDCNKTNESITSNTIVSLHFKAQPDKGPDAVTALTNLIEKVKQEPHFVTIRIHVDPNDNTNIFLYEEWSNASYYNNEHMETPHLQKFMSDSKNFLTGPPEISFWKMERVFTP